MYNNQLDTFIQVADSDSFSEAGRKLFITPTAVIKQINLLENNLGLKLFVRTHRGITLTKAGESLYQDAKYIIQYSKDSIARGKKHMLRTNKIIRIGTSPMTPGEFLINLWPSIYKYCPNIKFQLIPFENTQENAREILSNLGKNIDIVAGIFDKKFLKSQKCNALEISKSSISCAMPVNHKLALKNNLTFQDMYGENLMLIKSGWNSYIDLLREEILNNHSKINIIDFDFYNTDIFNQCENSNSLLMTIDIWKNVHPLLKILPVKWNYTIPFGLFYPLEPSKTIQDFLNAVEKIIID